MNYKLIKLFSIKDMPAQVKEALNIVIGFMSDKHQNFIHYTLYSGQYRIPYYKSFFIIIDSYLIENGVCSDKNEVNLGETVLLDNANY